MIDYIVISLGEVLNDKSVDIKKIGMHLEEFSCEREKDLEEFLVRSAIHYDNIDFGKTFLIIDKEILSEKFKIAAFFTIANTSLDISILSKKQKRKVMGDFPGRDNLKSIAAHLIGQIGRDDNYSKEQLPGEVILAECCSRIEMARKLIGGKLMILECRESLREFYEKHGFIKLLDKSAEGLYTYYRKLERKEE